MENIDPSQTLLCTLKKQEPTRHQEMKLDFICADMAPSSADEWIRIATHPLYEPCLVLKENNVDKEEYYSELNAFEPNRVPGESILVPVPPLKSARPCVTTNTPQKTFQGSFKVDLDVQAEYMADLGRMRIESRDDEEFYDKWTDGLSACSDVENVVECCPQYDEATANSETHMCARCHRHKIIYDLNWPVRKIRKAPGKRRAPKKTPKQQQQQQALNPTVLASNIDPSLSSSSSSSSLHKPQPRHILAKPEPISASSPFPISPSAQNLFTSSYLQPCPLPVAPVTPLPPVPEQQFHHHSPTSPSPISATTSSQQQNLFADTLDSASTIEKFGNIRISSLPPNPAMRPMMLGSCVNQVTDSISEELDKNDMPSCSRQFNSLVPHVSVEPLRE
jgi:hypothetical protein